MSFARRFLSEEEMTSLAALARVREFQCGDLVLKQGEPCAPEVVQGLEFKIQG